MMNAGHFSRNLESSGDLNRPRSPEGRNPRRVFAVLFARRKKYQSVPLQGAPRFCEPRISSPKQQLPTNKIKSFAALRPFLRPWRPFSVAAATNLCASRYYRRPCRLCNFPMESLSLPGRHTPCAFVCFSFKRKADGRQSRNTSDGYFRVARLGTLDRIRIKHRPMAAAI